MERHDTRKVAPGRVRNVAARRHRVAQSREKGGRPWRQRLRVAVLAIVVVFLAGCNGGCDMDGFTEAEYPPEHYDKTVPGSGEVRLTSHGLEFLGDEIDVLAEELMDDELSFCLEPTSGTGYDLCHEETECSSGETGCQIDLEIVDAELSPEEPNKLIVTVVVALHEQLPMTLGWADCWLELYSVSGGSDEAAEIEATVPVYFEIDEYSELDDLTVEIDDIELDIDDLDYSVEERDALFGCTVGDWIASFLDGTLRDMIHDEVDDAVEDLEDELCRTCEEGDLPCPQNAYCDEGDDEDDEAMCMYDAVDECVPMLLGIEGILEIDELIDEYLPHGAEGVHLTGRLADRAEANTGVSLGLKLGTEPENETTCAPVYAVERPSFEPIDPAPSLQGDTDPSGNPYHFGLAIHQRTIQHLMWSIWAGGGLCLEVGADEVEMLTTNAFTLFVDSLADIATEDGPMKIVLSPQTPPDVELGANEVDDGEVVDGLIDLLWDDLDIHMYGYVQERYARLFTLRVDLELPVALIAEDGGVLPVLGDVEGAIQNLRVQNDDLIAEDEETFEELIPTILDFALPELMDALDEPIELPDLEGYQPVIEEGGLTAIDDDEYIGLFAKLEYVGTDDDGEEYRLDTARALVSDKTLVVEDDERAVPRVTLNLDVGAEMAGAMLPGEDVEYLYRVGGGPWRLAGAGPELVIDSPSLRLPGEHTLELRARKAQDRNGRWQAEPTRVDVMVNYEAPDVEAWLDDGVVEVRAEDVVDGVSALEMSYRYVVGGEAGAWSVWNAVEAIAVGDAPVSDVEAVEIRVRDRAGLVGEERVEIQTTEAPVVAGEAAGSERDKGPRYGGCQSTTTAPSTALIIVVALLVLSALRRRWRPAVAVASVALLGLTAACSDDVSGEENGNEQEEDPPCGGECDEGLVCCHETDSCEEPPESCTDYECDPGYDAFVEAEGEYLEDSCEMSGAACGCQVRDPIDVGYYGSYPSVAAGGGVVALSVHNMEYGDLMVAIVDEEEADGVLDIDEWHFVDGVPEDANVAGSPYGPRGGIIRSGPEVGTHTATAVDAGGGVHVFYRDEDENNLKYARGADGEKGEAFEWTIVDDDGDTGYYSEVGLRGDRLYVFYTAVDEDGASQIRHRSFDVDHPMDDVEATEVEIVHPPVVDDEEDDNGDNGDNGEEDNGEEEDFVDYPQMVGLFLQLETTPDGEWFLSFYDNASQRAGWIKEEEDGFGEAEFLDDADAGPYASATVDADGEVHVAYMDRSVPALIYRAGADSEREYIAGGVRDREAGWSETTVGHDVKLYVGDEGADLLFHDASTHEIRRALRNDEGIWEVESLAGELGTSVVGRGFFVRALALDDRRVMVDFAVDTTDGDDPQAYPVIQPVE